MLSMKEAAQKAIIYFMDLYGEQAPKNIRLEEMELSEDSTRWYITLGYDAPNPEKKSSSSVALALTGIGTPPEFYRDFKVFSIDAETGNVVSMKIRQVG